MLWLVCLFAAAAQFTQVLCKATLEREIRWGLYRVRDNLRWAGIERPALLQDPRFWELDDSLTLKCRHLDVLSLWTMIAIARTVSRSEVESVVRALNIEQNPLRPFYEEAANLLVQYVQRRHLLLGRIGLKWITAQVGQDSSAAAEYFVAQPPLAAPAKTDWTLRSRVEAATRITAAAR